jgi:type IV pilus assembly protein PilA
MFTYFNKLRNKKGFTLIELVIVIAIVAIMAAVGVPNYLASQRRAQATSSSDYARGFYFALQQTLLAQLAFDATSDEFTLVQGGALATPSNRVSGTSPIVNWGGNFYLYAEMDNAGGISFAELRHGAALTSTTPVIATHNPGGTLPATPHNNGQLTRIIAETENYLSASSGGFIYAMFDSNFRVTVVYYSQFADWAATGGGAVTFSREHLDDAGRTFGSHPREYSFLNNSIGGTAINGASATWFLGMRPNDL